MAIIRFEPIREPYWKYKGVGLNKRIADSANADDIGEVEIAYVNKKGLLQYPGKYRLEIGKIRRCIVKPSGGTPCYIVPISHFSVDLGAL